MKAKANDDGYTPSGLSEFSRRAASATAAHDLRYVTPQADLGRLHRALSSLHGRRVTEKDPARRERLHQRERALIQRIHMLERETTAQGGTDGKAS